MSGSKVTVRPSIRRLKPSATLLINERSKELAAKGRKIYRLGFGQSPFPVPAEVVRALQYHAHEKDYLPVKGLAPLRHSVAQFNQRVLDVRSSAENIMIGPGSKELILGLQLVCHADLVLPSPSWVSYEPQAHIVQNKVIWIETREEDRWLLSAEKLEQVGRRHGSRPLILLLNYPNNPVGTTYSEKELRDIARIAGKYEMLVVADEIYGEMNFLGNHQSLAKYYPEGTIISSGLSKWCGAGGWRLGTFTFPDECRHILEAMATIASESFSAVSAPVQYAAITAFDSSQGIEKYLQHSRKILRAVGDYVFQALTAIGVSMPQAQGGFYLFPNFEYFRPLFQKRGILSGIELCERLLEETGVALLPGVAFGRPEGEYTCRLSFVDFDGAGALEAVTGTQTLEGVNFVEQNCPNIAEAMKSLKTWLKN